MAERHSPDPPHERPNGQRGPTTYSEEHLHDRDEEDEPYTDPEHARRLAAVRTELFRRSQARWTSEE